MTDVPPLTYVANAMPGPSNVPGDAYPSRTRARLETRSRVFEAALAEFRRVGVAGAQVEDIVRAAGVARGTFYLHFATKDHVLLEILRRMEGAVAEQLRENLARPLDEFLLLAVRRLSEVATGEDTAIVPDVLAMIARREDLIAASKIELVEVVTRFLVNAQKRGEVRREVRAEELAQVFLSGVFGVLIARTRDAAGLRSAMERAADVFVRGFRA